MQMQPNGTIVDGVVKKITPERDGFGTTIQIAVEQVKAAPGKKDFINAAKGELLTLFHAGPEPVTVGRKYRLTASVLGGPNGTRNVVERISR